METYRPFLKGFFAIHNCVFDIMMPELSPTAFKVLCVAIRATMGWNKDSDTISYTQFMERSGIKSDKTITKAIRENLEHDYLIRKQVGVHNRTGKPIYAYELNTDLEIEVNTVKNTVINTVKNTDTTVHTKHQHDDDDIYLSLTQFGIDKNTAEKLSETITADQVHGWLAYIETHEGINNPVGFLISRLRSGEAAPQIQAADKAEAHRQALIASYKNAGILT